MVYLISILIYLFALTGIGIYKSRQVKTQADFAVAGRTLSPWVLVCTMLAVWIDDSPVPRDAFDMTVVPDGATVQIIHMISGG